MTFLRITTVALVAFATLGAQSQPEMKATMRLLHPNLVVGDEPLVLFRIINLSKQMVFIDQSDFRTVSDFHFEGEPTVPGGLPGITINASSHQSKYRSWPTCSIVGIEPGKSIVRVVQVCKAEKQGQATLSVTAGFRTSFANTINDAYWPEHVFTSAELKVKIQPAVTP